MIQPPAARTTRIAPLVIGVFTVVAALVIAVVITVIAVDSEDDGQGAETGASEPAGQSGAGEDAAGAESSPEGAAERYFELAAFDNDPDAARALQCEDYVGHSPEELFVMVTGALSSEDEESKVIEPSRVEGEVAGSGSQQGLTPVRLTLESEHPEGGTFTYYFDVGVEESGGGWLVCEVDRSDS